MERFLGSKKPWLKTCTGIAQPWRNGGSRIFLPVDKQFVTKKPIAHLKLSCFDKIPWIIAKLGLRH